MLSTFAALAGCDAAAEVAIDDSAAALSAPSVYLFARQDTRKCAAPMCGGLWVRRANFATTKCADGVYRAECYVAQASYGAVHFDAGEREYFEGRLRAGLALVRGQVAEKTYGDFGNLGVLKVSEAWDAWTDQVPAGTVHALAATGIVCISAPCPTLEATEVNRPTAQRQITGVDLSKLNTAEETKLDLMNLAYTDRLLVAGEIDDCGQGHVELRTTQAFRRLFHKVDVAGDWRFTGSDRSRYNYSFRADGTFGAHMEPGCLFSRPRCALRMAFLEGKYVVDGERVQLEYTSTFRHGETAELVITGAGASTRLVGDDFGLRLSLRRLAQ